MYRALTTALFLFLASPAVLFAAATTPSGPYDLSIQIGSVVSNELTLTIRAGRQNASTSADIIDARVGLDTGSGQFAPVGTPKTIPTSVLPSRTDFSTRIPAPTCGPRQVRLQIRFIYQGTTYVSEIKNFTRPCNGQIEILPDGTYIIPSQGGGQYRLTVVLPGPTNSTADTASLTFRLQNQTSPLQTPTVAYEFGPQGGAQNLRTVTGLGSGGVSERIILLNNLTCETAYTVRPQISETISGQTTVHRVPSALVFTHSCGGGGATDGALSIVSGVGGNDAEEVIFESTIEVPNFQTHQGKEVRYGFEVQTGQGRPFVSAGQIQTSQVSTRSPVVPTIPLTVSVGRTGTITCSTTYMFRGFAEMRVSGPSPNRYYSNPETLTTQTCPTGGNTGGNGNPGGSGNGNGGGIVREGEYYLLAPSLPFAEDGKVRIGEESIGAFVARAFNFIITIAIVLAVIFLIYGGAKYATSDAAFNLQEGRKIIVNAVTGLLFALFSWVLLNTLNPDLLRANLLLPGLQNIVGTIGGNTGGNTGGNGNPGGSGTSTPPNQNQRLAAILAVEDQTRERLAGGGVAINNPKCTEVGQRNCTLVGLVGEQAITEVIALKSRCNCSVTITGGTEWWAHSTHAENRNILDLRLDTLLNTFIQTNGQPATPYSCSQGGGGYFSARYSLNRDGVSGTFFREDCRSSSAPHWHVQF